MYRENSIIVTNTWYYFNFYCYCQKKSNSESVAPTAAVVCCMWDAMRTAVEFTGASHIL